MAAEPTAWTSNSCDDVSSVVAVGTRERHVSEFKGYSWMAATMPNGKGIQSAGSFRVGPCTSWHIELYPNGDHPGSSDFVSLFATLDHASALDVVQANVQFDLLDAAGNPVPRYTRIGGVHDFVAPDLSIGFDDFIERGELERSLLVKDDSLSVRCTITVVEFVGIEAARCRPPPLAVPPSDWPQHFRALLCIGQGADVTFCVDGETFNAHRCVLAARSPVFKAELFGAMMESDSHVVRIDDMKADVFRNLLHFIYTDSLPLGYCEEGDQQEAVIVMAQHLMVAADRYGMERLKLICEDRLCRCMNVATAATTLVLADQHRCDRLKKACFHFLKSPSTLHAVMGTDEFEHLAKSHPCLLKELMLELAAR